MQGVKRWDDPKDSRLNESARKFLNIIREHRENYMIFVIMENLLYVL